MNNEFKLHQALYEMKAVAEQLYPLYEALTDEIERFRQKMTPTTLSQPKRRLNI